MVRPETVKPFAELVGQCFPNCKDKPYRWRTFNTKNDAIYARDQDKDDAVHFSRRSDWEARLALYDIAPLDMVDIKVSKPTTVKTEPRYSARVELDNKTGTDQSTTITQLFRNGQQTMNEVKTGLEIGTKTTVGTGEGSSVKFEQEVETKVTNEWTKQTGITSETEAGGEFPVVVPARSHIQAWVIWNESDLKRHLQGECTFDCKIQAGKRGKKSKYDSKKAKNESYWKWEGDYTWDSVDEFTSVLRGDGSVNAPLGKFYRDPKIAPPGKLIEQIEKRPRVPYSQWVEYKGIQDVKVDYEVIEKYPEE